MERKDRLFRDQVRQTWSVYQRAALKATSRAWSDENADAVRDAADARRYRTKFLTASRSLTHVTHSECIFDRARAVVHALLLVDQLYDPISEYEARLSSEVEIWRRRANGALTIAESATIGPISNSENGDGICPVAHQTREDGTQISEADRIRAEIARLESIIEEFKIEEPSESAAMKNLEDEAKKAADYAELRCREYEQVLARPSYQLDYDDLFRRAQGAIPKESSTPDHSGSAARQFFGSANATARTFWEKIGELLRDGLDEILLLFKDPLSSAFFWIVFPAEVLFTLPAFQVMMPNMTAAAYAAAIIYTSVLVGLAAATWMIFRQSFEWSVPSASATNANNSIWPKGRPRPLVILFGAAVCVLGLFVCFWGADLRGRVPEASILQEQRDDLQGQYDSPSAQVSTVEEAKASEEAHKQIGADLDKVEGQERDLLKFRASDFQVGSILQAVSLAVYLGLFVLVIARLKSESDPYPNYELWSSRLESARLSEWGFRLGREIGQGLLEAAQKNALAELREKLRERRSALWLLAPSDPKALGPAPFQGGTRERAEDDTQKKAVTSADDELLKRLGLQGHLGKLWVRDRLRRYTRTYCYLAGRRLLAKHPKSISYALNQEPS